MSKATETKATKEREYGYHLTYTLKELVQAALRSQKGGANG